MRWCNLEFANYTQKISENLNYVKFLALLKENKCKFKVNKCIENGIKRRRQNWHLFKYRKDFWVMILNLNVFTSVVEAI